MVAKTAVETLLIGGAEGFLGSAALVGFSKRGLKIVGACRTSQDLERMQDVVRKEQLTGVTLLQADLGDEAQVRNLIAEGEKRSGVIDGLFNAAGAFRYGSVADATLSDYDTLITANFKSSFLLARAVVGNMTKRGFGRMVFVSSRATLGLGEANMALYLASKAALNALVTSLAAEVKATGVTVNAVMPSTIDTPANRQSMATANFADWVTPDALVDIISTLLTGPGTPINGALIPVAGRL